MFKFFWANHSFFVSERGMSDSPIKNERFAHSLFLSWSLFCLERFWVNEQWAMSWRANSQPWIKPNFIPHICCVGLFAFFSGLFAILAPQIVAFMASNAATIEETIVYIRYILYLHFVMLYEFFLYYMYDKQEKWKVKHELNFKNFK